MQLPPALERAWHARGYYGSVSHNVKAIYQRYMGWYDGNPAHLWQHPPVEAGEALRGRHGRRGRGAGAGARGRSPRATSAGSRSSLNHLVFAEPGNAAAKALQADALEQLGFGSENGTWRCAYLAGAHRAAARLVRDAGLDRRPRTCSRALSPEQIFDAIAIRVDGPRAWDETLSIGVVLTDVGASYRLDLRNGVLVHRAGAGRRRRRRRCARRARRCPASSPAARRGHHRGRRDRSSRA